MKMPLITAIIVYHGKLLGAIQLYQSVLYQLVFEFYMS